MDGTDELDRLQHIIDDVMQAMDDSGSKKESPPKQDGVPAGHHMIRKKRPKIEDAQVVSRTEEEEDVDIDMDDSPSISNQQPVGKVYVIEPTPPASNGSKDTGDGDDSVLEISCENVDEPSNNTIEVYESDPEETPPVEVDEEYRKKLQDMLEKTRPRDTLERLEDGCCQICGEGKSRNSIKYGGIWTCISCRRFYQGVLTGPLPSACRFGQNCKMTPVSRNMCDACRYNKFAQVGFVPPEGARPTPHSVVTQNKYACRVCGDMKANPFGNIYTCAPCKRFYNRFKSGTPIQPCNFNNMCVLTPETKSNCPQCRVNRFSLAGFVDPDGIPAPQSFLPSPTRMASVVPPKPQGNMAMRGQPCIICGSGKSNHFYNISCCQSCSSFFSATVKKGSPLVCKSGNCCEINESTQKNCPACRLHKFTLVGFSPPDGISFERLLQVKNCAVCGDDATKCRRVKNLWACSACQFFVQNIKEQTLEPCRFGGLCEVNVNTRNDCKYCRYRRCLEGGILKTGMPSLPALQTRSVPTVKVVPGLPHPIIQNVANRSPESLSASTPPSIVSITSLGDACGVTSKTNKHGLMTQNQIQQLLKAKRNESATAKVRSETVRIAKDDTDDEIDILDDEDDDHIAETGMTKSPTRPLQPSKNQPVVKMRKLELDIGPEGKIVVKGVEKDDSKAKNKKGKKRRRSTDSSESFDSVTPSSNRNKKPSRGGNVQSNREVNKGQVGECVVCGSTQQCSEFKAALVCQNCQAFLTGRQKDSELWCHEQGHCEITVANRGNCPGCRYNKAASMGLTRPLPLRVKKRKPTSSKPNSNTRGGVKEKLTGNEGTRRSVSRNPSEETVREPKLLCAVCGSDQATEVKAKKGFYMCDVCKACCHNDPKDLKCIKPGNCRIIKNATQNICSHCRYHKADKLELIDKNEPPLQCEVCNSKKDCEPYNGVSLCYSCFWFVHNKQTRDYMECNFNGRCVVDPKYRCGGCRYYKASALGACKPLQLRTKKAGVLPAKGVGGQKGASSTSKASSKGEDSGCVICGSSKDTSATNDKLICAACKWFIKDKQYHRYLVCEKSGDCTITAKNRNDCKGCRYSKAARLGVCKTIPVRVESIQQQSVEDVQDVMEVDYDESDTDPTNNQDGGCCICGSTAYLQKENPPRCKACMEFMRKTAQKNFLPCNKSGKCKVTLSTRSDCRGCRYNKGARLGHAKEKALRNDDGKEIYNPTRDTPLKSPPRSGVIITSAASHQSPALGSPPLTDGLSCVVCKEVNTKREPSRVRDIFGVTICRDCESFINEMSKSTDMHYCVKGHGRCQVNTQTRHLCNYCRYMECVASGLPIKHKDNFRLSKQAPAVAKSPFKAPPAPSPAPSPASPPAKKQKTSHRSSRSNASTMWDGDSDNDNDFSLDTSGLSDFLNDSDELIVKRSSKRRAGGDADSSSVSSRDRFPVVKLDKVDNKQTGKKPAAVGKRRRSSADSNSKKAAAAQIVGSRKSAPLSPNSEKKKWVIKSREERRASMGLSPTKAGLSVQSVVKKSTPVASKTVAKTPVSAKKDKVEKSKKEVAKETPTKAKAKKEEAKAKEDNLKCFVCSSETNVAANGLAPLCVNCKDGLYKLQRSDTLKNLRCNTGEFQCKIERGENGQLVRDTCRYCRFHLANVIKGAYKSGKYRGAEVKKMIAAVEAGTTYVRPEEPKSKTKAGPKSKTKAGPKSKTKAGPKSKTKAGKKSSEVEVDISSFDLKQFSIKVAEPQLSTLQLEQKEYYDKYGVDSDDFEESSDFDSEEELGPLEKRLKLQNAEEDVEVDILDDSVKQDVEKDGEEGGIEKEQEKNGEPEVEKDLDKETEKEKDLDENKSGDKKDNEVDQNKSKELEKSKDKDSEIEVESSKDGVDKDKSEGNEKLEKESEDIADKKLDKCSELDSKGSEDDMEVKESEIEARDEQKDESAEKEKQDENDKDQENDAEKSEPVEGEKDKSEEESMEVDSVEKEKNDCEIERDVTENDRVDTEDKTDSKDSAENETNEATGEPVEVEKASENEFENDVEKVEDEKDTSTDDAVKSPPVNKSDQIDSKDDSEVKESYDTASEEKEDKIVEGNENNEIENDLDEKEEENEKSQETIVKEDIEENKDAEPQSNDELAEKEKEEENEKIEESTVNEEIEKNKDAERESKDELAEKGIDEESEKIDESTVNKEIEENNDAEQESNDKLAEKEIEEEEKEKNEESTVNKEVDENKDAELESNDKLAEKEIEEEPMDIDSKETKEEDKDNQIYKAPEVKESENDSGLDTEKDSDEKAETSDTSEQTEDKEESEEMKEDAAEEMEEDVKDTELDDEDKCEEEKDEAETEIENIDDADVEQDKKDEAEDNENEERRADDSNSVGNDTVAKETEQEEKEEETNENDIAATSDTEDKDKSQTSEDNSTLLDKDNEPVVIDSDNKDDTKDLTTELDSTIAPNPVLEAPKAKVKMLLKKSTLKSLSHSRDKEPLQIDDNFVDDYPGVTEDELASRQYANYWVESRVKIKCRHCGEKGDELVEVVRHVIEKHCECQGCGQEFPEIHILAKHTAKGCTDSALPDYPVPSSLDTLTTEQCVISETASGSVACKLCLEEFPFTLQAREHIDKIHIPQKPQYECEDCHTTFFKKSSFWRHLCPTRHQHDTVLVE